MHGDLCMKIMQNFNPYFFHGKQTKRPVAGHNWNSWDLFQELNSSFGMSIATDIERTVRVTQKGLTLVVVNRLHALLGYDVVSHAMAMTNANRELVSFTMYKKTGTSSHGHSHGHTHSSSHKSHSHSNVVTL